MDGAKALPGVYSSFLRAVHPFKDETDEEDEMRKSEEVKVNDEAFTVHELRVKDMLDIMPRMSDEDQLQEATMDLMKLSVYQDGMPMGDDIEEMGLSTYMGLTQHVMEINGLVGKD